MKVQGVVRDAGRGAVLDSRRNTVAVIARGYDGCGNIKK
jgi:hypothetical protein